MRTWRQLKIEAAGVDELSLRDAMKWKGKSLRAKQEIWWGEAGEACKCREQQQETRGVCAAQGAETLGEEPPVGCCAEPLRGGPSLILTNTLQGRNSVLHLIDKVAEAQGS